MKNILILCADDLGYGEIADLFSYTAYQAITPNISGLAATGQKWVRMHSPSCVCSPSRASMLTGEYPWIVGVQGAMGESEVEQMGYFNPRFDTLPELFADNGYRTGFFGKWHLGLEAPNIPTSRGFHEFKGLLASRASYNSPHLHPVTSDDWFRDGTSSYTFSEHTTDRIALDAVQFIDDAVHVHGQPFVCHVCFTAPHAPIEPTTASLNAVTARLGTGVALARRQIIALIEHMDAAIGTILAKLTAEGLDNDTVVVFTSDNGGATSYSGKNGGYPNTTSYAALKGGKFDLYFGGLMVPFLVKSPGDITGGTTRSHIAGLQDIYPTLCSAAGITAPSGLIGSRDLWSYCTGSPSYSARELRFIWRYNDNTYKSQAAFGVLDSSLGTCLFNNPTLGFEAYGPTDYGQATNNPTLANTMAPLVHAAVREAGKYAWQEPY